MKTGEKIRLLREEKGIELAEMARRSQTDAGIIEKIESGILSPPLGILTKVARALGTRLGTFLDDSPVQNLVLTRGHDIMANMAMDEAASKSKQNLRYSSLAKDKANRHMEPFLVEILPGDENQVATSSHEGEEFIYVISGEVSVKIGKEAHLLKAGDSIYIDSIVNHQVSSGNGEKALIVAVIYMPV